ncbi:MAG: hypothetical protein AAGI71_07655 [Bacteroidota bacterium]
MRRLLPVLACALLLAGCTSTEKLYNRAVEREEDGQLEEAVEAYLDVLERDEAYEDAAERLAEAGGRLVEQYLDEARALAQDGAPAAAAERLAALDDLRSRSADVGVELEAPPGYADERQRIRAEAVAALIDRADTLFETGAWGRALDAYEEAEAYTEDPEQQRTLVESQGRVLRAWAEEELAEGAFRSAFDRAQQGLERVAEPDRAALLAVQDQAVGLGTRAVAVVPFVAADALRGRVPGGMLQDLNDILIYDYWAEPPLFLALINPVDTRRWLRDEDVQRRSITNRQASRLGRDLEADFVVVGELTELDYRERGKKERTYKARVRGRDRTDTTYVVERYTLRIETEVTYLLIDVESREVVEEATYTASTSEDVERGRFAGNVDNLVLDRDEAAYFDEEAQAEQERLMINELVEEMAANLAERSTAWVLARVP